MKLLFPLLQCCESLVVTVSHREGARVPALHHWWTTWQPGGCSGHRYDGERIGSAVFIRQKSAVRQIHRDKEGLEGSHVRRKRLIS